MNILNAIIIEIGIVIGLIVLTVLVAFLVELVKAFAAIGKNKSERGDVNNGSHRDD